MRKMKAIQEEALIERRLGRWERATARERLHLVLSLRGAFREGTRVTHSLTDVQTGRLRPPSPAHACHAQVAVGGRRSEGHVGRLVHVPCARPCQLHPHCRSPVLPTSPPRLRMTRGAFPRFPSPGPRRARDHAPNSREAARVRASARTGRTRTLRPLSRYWSERPGFRLESLWGQGGGGATALGDTPGADWPVRVRGRARMFKLPALCGGLAPRPPALGVSGPGLTRGEPVRKSEAELESEPLERV